MSPASATTSGARRFDHPVIDSDGHFVEFFPAFLDYFRAVAGPDTGDRFEAEWNRTRQSADWYDRTTEERRQLRLTRPGFWNIPTRNTLDLATAMLPELLYERLDELGSDFVVLYPGLGLVAPQVHDEEVRRAACRALNKMYADIFRDFSSRMTPVAVIPMHTPEEALGELDYVVRDLGLKAIRSSRATRESLPPFAAARTRRISTTSPLVRSNAPRTSGTSSFRASTSAARRTISSRRRHSTHRAIP
jgi:hypothetical protein